jgi:hypothetical protein
MLTMVVRRAEEPLGVRSHLQFTFQMNGPNQVTDNTGMTAYRVR